ncbi:zinc ABC transporter substrate-binding protein [Suttonella sp. R2A3]|uniref:zinc ABC transporter substrate-binding protein n=1 Tax=Suttonella sp. R2A3 TaxID=2908648 RepID=UPI001F30709B|nr:zinc ABC transporter substrate-binding protein [Suttonella sp. R2A3]UJF24022.1 zinc ABC transporter substrate-binding protein [Suttonella sp. R2A3]
MTKRFLLIVLAALSTAALATPNVVTTIKPLHSLVSHITDGVTEPTLLIEQGSPHGYQLKPSDTQALSAAQVVVYVDDALEVFLPDVLAKTAGEQQVIRWSQLPDVTLLDAREGGLWPEHHHDDHAEGDHHDDHTEADHQHGEHDLHVWLDIANAQALVKALTQTLSKLDPEHSAQYQANLEQTLNELTALDGSIKQRLMPVKDQPFMVFHDAYQYLEHAYDLRAIGAVRVSPEHEPGAKRVGEIRQLLSKQQAVCLFSEPQFPAKLTKKLLSGTDVREGILDPIGADLPSGKDLYPKLMDNLAQQLASCLAAPL